MTRYELEEWCEKFLKDIFENSKPMRELLVKAMSEDWDEDVIQAEVVKLINSQTFKEYSHYRKELADFIENFAKELASHTPTEGNKQ